MLASLAIHLFELFHSLSLAFFLASLRKDQFEILNGLFRPEQPRFFMERDVDR